MKRKTASKRPSVRSGPQRKHVREIGAMRAFISLNDAVGDFYREDKIRAGIVTSSLSIDPPMYYASVCRYSSGNNRNVVLGMKGPSLLVVLRLLSEEWLKKVRPPPKEDQLSRLEKVLLDTDPRPEMFRAMDVACEAIASGTGIVHRDGLG